MNLSLSKLPWYAQVGAFVALSAAAAGVFWYGYAQPAQESLASAARELATLRGEIERGLATARRLPEFRREVADLQAQLDRLRVVLPEERDVADLLRRVQAMATQSNLTILGFTPQAITTRELHAEWPIGLQLEGTYHNLGAFLERDQQVSRASSTSTPSRFAPGRTRPPARHHYRRVHGDHLRPDRPAGAGSTRGPRCGAAARRRGRGRGARDGDDGDGAHRRLRFWRSRWPRARWPHSRLPRLRRPAQAPAAAGQAPPPASGRPARWTRSAAAAVR